ncbi:MAG: GIY-YIG nuclease family protein [Bacteroidia bacterium]
MKTKKDLKEEYKQMKFKMGVFQIRNTLNHKIFVDGSTNLDAIWNRHRAQLNFGGHPNAILQKDWNNFGQENFVFEILAELKQSETGEHDYNKEVKQLSEMFIDELKPFDEKGYHKKVFG